MRKEHYLIAEGFTPKQRETFERERIAVLTLCVERSRTLHELGQFIGVYQAKKVIADLVEDGYLTRVMRTKTGDIAYRFNFNSIQPRQFFIGR